MSNPSEGTVTSVEPIWMDCPGSNAATPHYVCPYCGVFVPPESRERIPEHRTEDILAMIERGDFG